ncbi:hypothetical protein O181_016846 [Austropuccinia psidii MF-1]|uniref:Uncharacterized protein n=1 Tax=Austropuccinia psidii MF-1 TaxID=1389203 RepID=A0A9Q3GRG0_9BASI|nr:hypothetical protein [Austropuccinia psidii MF-1]
MIETWIACLMDNGTYFKKKERDSDYHRNLIALSFIWNSTERALFDSVISQIVMPNARNVYQAIRSRFRKASWSSIVRHARKIFHPVDKSHNIVKHAINFNETIKAIECQLGPLDSHKILTLSLFFLVPTMQDQITLALETRLAANPKLAINMEDILDLVQQLSHSSDLPLNQEFLQISIVDASTLQPSKGKQQYEVQPFATPSPPSSQQKHSQKFNPSYSSSLILQQSEGWKNKWLTHRNPCCYCG